MQLQDVRCFLLDMDGTFYLGGQIIPGSLEFIEKVVSSGRDFMFLTNNSSRGTEAYLAKMKRLGIPAAAEDFLTSADATKAARATRLRSACVPSAAAAACPRTDS